MPYTGNRRFKRYPRIITAAQGVHLIDDAGRKILDGASGLWTTGAGHNRPEIAQAIARQFEVLDYAPAFQYAHPGAIALANRLAALVPGHLNHVFFTNSGSECADTALKMARAYWQRRGQPQKTKLIGRVSGYHGVNFGGTAVGGIPTNRALFEPLENVAHLSNTLLPENQFCRGYPDKGAELADELTAMVEQYGAQAIAAVIVEPIAASGGVLPPPVGYLQRLRELCTQHDILLIFDEVITGLGRCGAMTVAQLQGVQPDILTLAKQLTNGAVPLGAVLASSDIYATIMDGAGHDYLVEFPHGYTYSGHPIACAAAMASLDILEQEALPQRVAAMSTAFEERLHQLHAAPHVVDIRNAGFAGALQLAHYPDEPARRPVEVAQRLWEKGFYVRYGGDTIALGLPFVIEMDDIDRLISAIGDSLYELAA